jgi:hypothetical protein
MILLCSCANKLSKEQSSKLLTFYKEKNFFKLEELMSKIKFDNGNPDLVLYSATLDNAFNRPEESNRLINILLNEYPKYFSDTIVKNLYSMRSANAFRLQDYKNAYIYDSIINTQYRHVCDSSEIDIRNDDITIFRCLKDVPKMEIKIPQNSKIPVSRDLANFQNVPVTLQSDTVDFVFDTGAQFSVILESIAKKYGAKILSDKIKTGTSNSKKVEGRMGLLDIKLGAIELKNVAFIVLPDSCLTFAHGRYVIKGIIGFPVMYAFSEFTLKENELIISSQNQQQSNCHNFAIDGQYLIFSVTVNNDTLPFIFDSGSQRTDLSSKFFNTYKSDILANCDTLTKTTGGVGGIDTCQAFKLDSISISAGNSQYMLDSIVIFPTDLSGSDMKYIYGNIGQDYVSKFTVMKISFASMNISFEGIKK